MEHMSLNGFNSAKSPVFLRLFVESEQLVVVMGKLCKYFHRQFQI